MRGANLTKAVLPTALLVLAATWTGCLVLAALGSGCAMPADAADGDMGMNGVCADCHMVEGDGIVPPENHWAGGAVDPEHDACTQCHAGH